MSSIYNLLCASHHSCSNDCLLRMMSKNIRHQKLSLGSEFTLVLKEVLIMVTWALGGMGYADDRLKNETQEFGHLSCVLSTNDTA